MINRINEAIEKVSSVSPRVATMYKNSLHGVFDKLKIKPHPNNKYMKIINGPKKENASKLMSSAIKNKASDMDAIKDIRNTKRPDRIDFLRGQAARGIGSRIDG